MAQFFNSSGIRFRELKTFLVQNAERVKPHAMIIAEQEGRPYVYLHEKVRKEDLAKQIAERDHIEQGLICILSVLEPCRSFSFRSEKGKPFVASARRKCLFLYFYFINRDFGLMHVRLQTWVSDADPGLPQWTGVARPEIEAERHSLYQARQCV